MPTVINFATSNKAKIATLQKVLEPFDIQLRAFSMNFLEPRSDDTSAIAVQKALDAFEMIKQPVLTNDAGFYIHALKGFPKAFVNFALETIGIHGILKLMEGHYDRDCEFRSCLAYMDSQLDQPIVFSEIIPGDLAKAVQGELPPNAWSELWLVFKPQGFTKTIAQLTPGEFGRWQEETRGENHIGTQFARWLQQRKK